MNDLIKIKEGTKDAKPQRKSNYRRREGSAKSHLTDPPYILTATKIAAIKTLQQLETEQMTHDALQNKITRIPIISHYVCTVGSL